MSARLCVYCWNCRRIVQIFYMGVCLKTCLKKPKISIFFQNIVILKNINFPIGPIYLLISFFKEFYSNLNLLLTTTNSNLQQDQCKV